MNFKLFFKDKELRTSITDHDGMLISSTTLQGTREDGGISDLRIKDDFNASAHQLMREDKLLLKTLKRPNFFCYTDTDV